MTEKQDSLTIQPARARRWLPLIILGGLSLSALITIKIYDVQLTLDTFHDFKQTIQTFTNENSILAILIYALIYTTTVALSLPFATLLTLLGGFLFGPWIGTLLVISSATLGATIVFLMTKTSLGASLKQKLGPKYDKIEQKMKENALYYLLFMRLVPIFPFWFVNIAPAIANIPTKTFIITTFFGIIPGSFAFVYAGQQLGNLTSLSDLLSTQTLLAFTMIGTLALIPPLYKRFKNRTNNESKT